MSYMLGKHCERIGVIEHSSLAEQSVQGLAGKDIGLGISLFHLIRNSFNKTMLSNCLTYINREGAVGITSGREWKTLLNLLKEINCTMTPAEKRWVTEPFGKMQGPESVVRMFRSVITGDLWFGVLDGCKRLSDLVMAQTEGHPSAGDFLLDLERISALGKWGRKQYSEKIFELYYGTGIPSEVAYSYIDSPYVCFRDNIVYWGTIQVLPQQIFPVLTSDGVLLLKSRSRNDELVPIMNCSVQTLNRQQFRRQSLSLEAEVLDRMQTIFRYP